LDFIGSWTDIEPKEAKEEVGDTLELFIRFMDVSEIVHAEVKGEVATTIPLMIIRSAALYLSSTVPITIVGIGESINVIVVVVELLAPSDAVTYTVTK